MSVVMLLDSIVRVEFVWYWLDEKEKWIEYGKKNSQHVAAMISSSEVEAAFLVDHKGIVFFQAGTQLYELNFQEMVQRNVYYQTKRRVSRWPRLVFFGGRQQNDKCRPFESSFLFHAFPSSWNQTALPDIGYKLVKVLESAEEHHEIKEVFERTMEGYVISTIRRIQNPSLWQVFQWMTMPGPPDKVGLQVSLHSSALALLAKSDGSCSPTASGRQRDQMKKLNGGKEVAERLLFHGTSTSHLHEICEQNFDWRICGTHGTLFGKGSYFARDASYSHAYCHSNTRTKTMIVARVLVGDYIPGKATYLRPPCRPNQANRFYDSCVDNTLNPSIFVIFEKHQIYPAYIIEYEPVSYCVVM